MNLALFMLLRGSAIFAGFLLTFYIAKALPSGDAGQVLYFLSLILASSSLARLGSDIQIVRQIASLLERGRPEVAHKVGKQAVLITVCASVLIVGIEVLAGKPVGFIPYWIDGWWLLAGVVCVSALYSGTEMLKAMMALNTSIVIQGLLPPLLILALFLLPGSDEHGLRLVTIGYALGAVTAVGYVIARASKGSWFGAPDREYLRGSLAYAPKAAVAFLYPHLPVVVLAAAAGGVAGVEAVAVIIKIGMVIGVPIVAINAFYAPRIARMHAAGQAGPLRQLYTKAALLSAASGALLLLILWLARERILGYFDLSPQQYAIAYAAVLVAQGVNALTGPIGIFAAMMKMDRLVNVAAALLLAGFLGIVFTGAAVDATRVLVAYALAWGVENLLLFAFVSHRLGLWSAGSRQRAD